MMTRLFALTGAALLLLTSLGTAQLQNAPPLDSKRTVQTADRNGEHHKRRSRQKLRMPMPPKDHGEPLGEDDILGLNEGISHWASAHHEFIAPSARDALVAKASEEAASGQVQEPYGGGLFSDKLLELVVLPSLKTYPLLVLNISPIPPTDYVVTINSGHCDFGAGQHTFYRVPPGHTVVLVTRPGATACRWEGDLADADHQAVDCNF